MPDSPTLCCSVSGYLAKCIFLGRRFRIEWMISIDVSQETAVTVMHVLGMWHIAAATAKLRMIVLSAMACTSIYTTAWSQKHRRTLTARTGHTGDNDDGNGDGNDDESKATWR